MASAVGSLVASGVLSEDKASVSSPGVSVAVSSKSSEIAPESVASSGFSPGLTVGVSSPTGAWDHHLRLRFEYLAIMKKIPLTQRLPAAKLQPALR